MKSNPVQLILVGALFASASMHATGRQETHWRFPGKTRVELAAVNGSCVLVQGRASEIRVDIASTFTPAARFIPSYVEMTDTLLLQEAVDSPGSGSARWTVTVPPHARIRFQSASGSLAVTGADIVMTANTDSGSIRLEAVTGVFNLFTRTGAIEVKGVWPAGESGFASESGAVSISLSRTPAADLFLFCKSGAVLLDYGTNPMLGSFRLEARAPEGQIRASVPFDRQETIDRNGTKFTVGIRRGEDRPSVRILTSTGTATLRAE